MRKSMSFADIEKAIAGLRKTGARRRLKLEDLQGGTFTITNGGTFGSLFSTPIVNPPQSAILGMHTIKERAIVGKRRRRRRADDVRRDQLRPPHHRRQGCGAVPGRYQESAGESAADAARDVTLRPLSIGRGVGVRDPVLRRDSFHPNPHPALRATFSRGEGKEGEDNERQFDVIVIGGGPAGYHAAIRAAQLGLKTACIDAGLGKDGKAALAAPACASAAFRRRRCSIRPSSSTTCSTASGSRHQRARTKIDVKAMVARKDKIVRQFTGGVALLFKATRSLVLRHRQAAEGSPGRNSARGRIETDDRGDQRDHCNGSVPIELPFAKFDNKLILDNAGALDVEAVPKRLGVIGAGVIGLELGSVWRRLGAEVTVLEALPDFLGTADRDDRQGRRARIRQAGSSHQAGCESQQGRDQGRHGRSHVCRRQG
jgi:hypothetical protein